VLIHPDKPKPLTLRSDCFSTRNLSDRSADIPVRLAEWVSPKADKMSALQKNPRSTPCSVNQPSETNRSASRRQTTGQS
jgi:hypothetical protein